MRTTIAATLLCLTITSTGCRSGAFERDRVARQRLERPVANQGDLLLGRFDLGHDHSHVLEVVASPEVQSIALVSTPSPADRGIAESYLVEVRFAGLDPEFVATVHVHEPTGLSIWHGDGGGSNSVLGIAAANLGWSRGKASGYADLELARRGVRLAGRSSLAQVEED